MTDAAPRASEHEDSPAGLAFAVSAYFLWGFLPLYMKAVGHISPVEVVAHRILWSVPFALVVLILLRRTSDIRAALTSPKLILMAAAPAAFISVNWGLYVWSIGSGHAIEAALQALMEEARQRLADDGVPEPERARLRTRLLAWDQQSAAERARRRAPFLSWRELPREERERVDQALRHLLFANRKELE